MVLIFFLMCGSKVRGERNRRGHLGSNEIEDDSLGHIVTGRGIRDDDEEKSEIEAQTSPQLSRHFNEDGVIDLSMPVSRPDSILSSDRASINDRVSSDYSSGIDNDLSVDDEEENQSFGEETGISIDTDQPGRSERSLGIGGF